MRLRGGGGGGYIKRYILVHFEGAASGEVERKDAQNDTDTAAPPWVQVHAALQGVLQLLPAPLLPRPPQGVFASREGGGRRGKGA